MKTQAIKIQIATGDPRPIFKQIVDGIRMQIARNELTPGAKLPSVRALALQLMINPNTVSKAYGELSSQGFLESRKGLGIFVKERSQILSGNEQQKRLDKAIESFINEVVYLDIPPKDILSQIKNQLMKVMKTKPENK